MPINANADDGAAATALDGVIVRGEQVPLADTALPGMAGAWCLRTRQRAGGG